MHRSACDTTLQAQESSQLTALHGRLIRAMFHAAAHDQSTSSLTNQSDDKAGHTDESMRVTSLRRYGAAAGARRTPCCTHRSTSLRAQEQQPGPGRELT